MVPARGREGLGWVQPPAGLSPNPPALSGQRPALLAVTASCIHASHTWSLPAAPRAHQERTARLEAQCRAKADAAESSIEARLRDKEAIEAENAAAAARLQENEAMVGGWGACWTRGGAACALCREGGRHGLRRGRRPALVAATAGVLALPPGPSDARGSSHGFRPQASPPATLLPSAPPAPADAQGSGQD